MLALFFALVALNIVDIVLTLLILKRGGRELNPVLAALFKRMPPALAMLIIKSSFFIALYFYLHLIPIIALQILVLGYVSLALWNFAQYKHEHQDKALHFAAGAFIAVIASPFGWPISLGMALLAGIGKEVYDHFTNGSVEALDILATVMGGIAAVVLIAVI